MRRVPQQIRASTDALTLLKRMWISSLCGLPLATLDSIGRQAKSQVLLARDTWLGEWGLAVCEAADLLRTWRRTGNVTSKASIAVLLGIVNVEIGEPLHRRK